MGLLSEAIRSPVLLLPVISKQIYSALGGSPPSAKPWKGLGPGVYELIEDHRGDTYRAVYTVRIADRVHVLHAFEKKSKSGVKTPKPEVDLIERRLKVVLERHRANRSQ